MDLNGYWLSIIVLGVPAWLFGIVKYYSSGCIPLGGASQVCGPSAAVLVIIFAVGLVVWVATPFIRGNRRK